MTDDITESKIIEEALDRICLELGMEKEELIRRKHITGYSKFYSDAEFSRAAMSEKQIEEKLKYKHSLSTTVSYEPNKEEVSNV